MNESIGVGSDVGGYRVTSLIGRGGMGAVYEVEQPATGQRFALKLLLPEHSASEEFRRRFGREARYASALEHPHIIRVHEVGDAAGQLYMVMDLVIGSDLAATVTGRGRLEPDEAIEILRQVGDALDAVHAEGLVHRDVKPANVVLAELPAGEPVHCYLTDFGLSKAPSRDSGPLTALGFFVGTSDYVAPEQIRAEDLDGRADVYSLGCMLYECLVGGPPFGRKAEERLLFSHLQDPPPLVTEHRPDLPAAIDDVVATAMAKDPADRFPTCAALIEAAALALGAPAAVPEPPPTVLILRVILGPAAGTEIAVADELVIGREAASEGTLGGDPELSRTHARVYMDAEGWALEDLGSTNGSHVNGTAVEGPVFVSVGDILLVGGTEIEVRAGEEPAAAEPEPVEVAEPLAAEAESVEVAEPLAAEAEPADPPPVRLSLRIRLDPAAHELRVECGQESVALEPRSEPGAWQLPG